MRSAYFNGVLLASALCQPCVAAPAVAPVSLLGIVLGQPFSTPRCGPKPLPGETCVVEKPSIDYGPSSVHSFELRMPSVDRPDFVKLGGVIVSVMNERVEGVILVTTGSDMQATALLELTAKFGPPASLQSLSVQNRFGAQFTYPDAIWRIGGAEIHFEGLSGTLDAGEIAATTARLRQQLVEQARLYRESGPHL